MSPLPPDPYKILGVSPDAQIPEIRSAHRKLVLKCHPDKVQDPQLKAEKQDEFQKVQQAYELLSDEKKRQRYDDQVKLAELRRQVQNKANISSPRGSPKFPAEFEIHTVSPRSNSYQHVKVPAGVKVYMNARGYDEEFSRGGARVVEPEGRSSRRGSAYEHSSKRDADRDRERERERDARDREQRREERERRKRAEEKAAKEAEKAAKEARREEKRRKEKLRDKSYKVATEEKRRHRAPYIESSAEEEILVSNLDRKKSSGSSKKHDETRERSIPRDEVPLSASPPPMPHDASYHNPRAERAAYKTASATSYIARSKGGVPLARGATYHAGVSVNPPAPTPPPSVQSPFAMPDDEEFDARRSSAKVRRGSTDTVKSARSYRKPSRDFDEPSVVYETSPSMRPSAQFPHPAAAAKLSDSPPRRDLPRTNTMPDSGYVRPIPSVARAHTFSVGEHGTPRGRHRSRLDSQIMEDDSEVDYDYDSEQEEQRNRDRERRHRAEKKQSRKARSPKTTTHYHVEGGRATMQPAHSRREREPTTASYYYMARPSMGSRESSYTTVSPASYKIKQSRSYGISDVDFTSHRFAAEEYAARA